MRLEESVRNTTDPALITLNCATILGKELEVDRCAYADTEADGNTINITGNYTNNVKSIVGRYQFTDFGIECLRLMTAGQPLIIEDIELDPRIKDVRNAYRQTEIGSVICVPLRRENGVVAAMAVHQNGPRVWTQDEIELVQLVANRCWESIERARVARELRTNEERYRILSTTVSAVVWNTDPEGKIPGECTSWGKFTGQSLDEYEGWGWLSAIHPEDRPHTIDKWKACVQDGNNYAVEYRLKRYDGEYRQMVARGVPVVGSDGAIREWIGNCNDITERRQAENEREILLANERATRLETERVSRMKDEFLATLSHELRTPLNAILGWAQVLRRGKKRSETDIAQGLDAIERNARVQTQLIEDLLDMSRIISGKLRLQIQQVTMSEVITTALAAVGPSAEAKKIVIDATHITSNNFVLGDPARLQQVISNLLTNAIKFTPAAGKVDISVEETDSYVEVAVHDTGIGITDVFLPYVFERFRQADASSSRRFSGLGLGLSLVKQITEMHGGKVMVESPGEHLGSTFTVRLPVSVAPITESRKEKSDPSYSSLFTNLMGVKILVIDDEPDARALIRRILEDCHADVFTAENTTVALEIIKSKSPDVIVSDIGMPDEDGHSFMRKLRGNTFGNPILTPAVALTAFATHEDKRRALESGFDYHISKPVEANELMAIVVKLIGRHRENDEEARV